MLNNLKIKITGLVLIVLAMTTLSPTISGLKVTEFATNIVEIETTYAQDSNSSNTDSTGSDSAEIEGQSELSVTYEKLLTNLSGLFSVILLFLSYLLWPILVVIGALMDNQLIIGGGMEDRLLAIWSQIRNLVNLGFAIGLVAVAIYNVFGMDSDGNYAIKKIIPKIILGLILVNFSFLGAKVVLDAANILTTAMFALPNTVEAQISGAKLDSLASDICGNINKISGSSFDFEGFDSSGFDQFKDTLCIDEKTFSASAREFFQDFNHNNMALIMAVQFGKIPLFLETSDLVRQDPSLTNLSINLLFSATMFVVYATAYIALLMVLLARIVVLWTAIALSPVLVLKIVLPDSFGEVGQIQEQFTKHLIAPIKIGLGMSVGYIMLSALEQVGPDSLNFSIADQFIAPFSGVNSVQQLIIMIATVGVVWTVVFSATDDTIAGRFVQTMTDWVRARGEFLASVPMYTATIPTLASGSGAPGVTTAGALQALSDFENRVRSKGLGQNVNEPPPLNSINRSFANGARNREAVTNLKFVYNDTNGAKTSPGITVQQFRTMINNSSIESRFKNRAIKLIDDAITDETTRVATSLRDFNNKYGAAYQKVLEELGKSDVGQE